MTTVLIIDDNRKNVELLRDFIESWGYATLSAYQGRKRCRSRRKNALILSCWTSCCLA